MNSGVDTNLGEIPPLPAADCAGKRLDIIIRVRVAKGFPGSVEKALPVNEADGSFVRGFRRQLASKIISPPEALQHIERAAISRKRLPAFDNLSSLTGSCGSC